MKIFSTIFCAVLTALHIVGYTQTKTSKGNSSLVKWTTDPFDHQVFILNNGQFDGAIPGNDKILYGAQLGEIWAYFTTNGLVYQYGEFPKRDEDSKGRDYDEVGSIKPSMHYLMTNWEGANTSAVIESTEELSYYYTYPKGTNQTIKTSIFKEITYKNIYPGIDVQYSFIKGKDGIKYALIVHPGADISKARLKYNGAKELKLNVKGDIRIESEMGEITDHAPISYYIGESGNLTSSYKLTGNEESFTINQGYDKTKTIVIDPWITDPLFANRDEAYDLDFDNQGNVYAQGGQYPYQLVKLNSSGNILWYFNISSSPFYGDFATDRRTGTCYVIAGTGANVFKINTLGTLIATILPNSNMSELWRAVYDPCNGDIIVAGGGVTSTYQACIIDTNMAAYIPVNVLGSPNAYHDMCLLATDPAGNYCYMATAEANNSTIFNNVVIRLPLSSLSPTSYIVSDGFSFQECSSILYAGPPPYTLPYKTNGMNGMAVSPSWLYMYDGAKLRQCSKATGLVNDSIKITTVSFTWGGIDVDECDNIYIGVRDSVKIYNSSLSLSTSLTLPNTVYDVALGNNNLLACGNGFVTAISTPFNNRMISSMHSISSNCSACNGKAYVNVTCGNPPYNFFWSNGVTGQDDTNLCAGTYSVTVTDGSCPPLSDMDTITVSNNVNLITPTINFTSPTCVLGGSATASPTGGTSPYTYLWNPSGQTSVTASGLSAGTYSVTITDVNGCSATTSVVVTQPATLAASISSFTNIHCNGGNTGNATVTVGGGSNPYTYAWTSSGGSAAVASNLTSGSYTVTVTDNDLCTATASITLTQPNILTANISASTNINCNGAATGNSTVTASGGTTPYTYLWSPSGGSAPIASNLSAGTYTINVTDGNSCSATASVRLTQPALLTVSANSVIDVTCNGVNDGSSTVSANGGVTPYTYSWLPTGGSNLSATGLSADTYTVNVSDANNCNSTAIITITQPLPVEVLVGPARDSICFGNNISLVASGANTYLWVPSLGLSCSNCPNPLASPTLTVQYMITGTNGAGCKDSALYTLNVVSNPIAAIQGNNVCKGSSVILSATGGASYIWNTGETNSSINVSPSIDTRYSVAVTESGCTDTASFKVMVKPIPLFELCCDSSIVYGQSVHLVSSGMGTYYWTPSVGLDCDTCRNLLATPLQTTTYTLTVTNDGCASQGTVTIDVTCGEIFVPNAFSPNGDGQNDILYVRGPCVKTMDFMIFDRWGNKVFESENTNNGWNGEFKGQPMNTGTYIYSLIAVLYDGSTVEKKGNVTLVR